MMRAVALLTLALVSAPLAAAGAQSDRLTFTVPVSVAALHPDLSMVRARCTLYADERGKAASALADGTSQPFATQAEGGKRAFMGDLDVPVFLDSADLAQVRSYRCALELYDASRRSWAEADRIVETYPLDPAGMAVTSIRGPLR
jgi:hypothetical protein